jgi:tetratricopeptide (TPR) repeat protein
MADTAADPPEKGAVTEAEAADGAWTTLRTPGGAATPAARGALGREQPGRYELRRELARGGQGVVFVAWDAQLGREVAFKQLLRPSAPRADGSLTPAEARFVREARITAQLDHPGIAPLFEVGLRADGSLYATQRLVAGRTLAAALEACPGLEERLGLLGVLRSVAETVAFAHRRGVIHRDLKPDNVIVTEKGEAVVLDWGLGRTGEEVEAGESRAAPVASLMESRAERTQDGAVLGTPAYMSPEQAVGDMLAVGPASDVWALGVMLYQLLTGRRPFEGTSTADVLRAVVSQPLPPVREVCPAAPAALAAVAQQALSRDPAARQRDAGAFLAQLSATPPVRPRRQLAWAVAGAAVLLALGGAASWRLRGSAGEGTAVVGWADLPMSAASSELARSKFREAMGLVAGGEKAAAQAALDEALKAEPNFASAALQRAWLGFTSLEPVQPGDREHFHVASSRRQELPPRDQAFLTALAPSFGDPPDWAESERRIRAYLEGRPGDVQAWDTLGILLTKKGGDGAAEAFAKEAELAPSDVAGHALWAVTVNETEREAVFADCVARRPANIDCQLQRLELARASRCDGKELERLARGLTAVAPGSSAGWSWRATAAALEGAPEPAIRDLLARSRALLPEASRAHQAAQDEFELARRRGDASAILRLSAEATPPPGGWSVRALWRDEEARLTWLWETGERQAAGREAKAFLERSAAFPVEETLFDSSLPLVLWVAHEGGQLDAKTWRDRRAAWIAAQRARLDEEQWKAQRLTIWAMAFDPLGEPTRALAEEAFQALDPLGISFDEELEGQTYTIGVGKLLLGAGRAAEALPLLERAAGWCWGGLMPPVRLILMLGRAHEEVNDVPAACAAYARVQAIWPDPKPRSLTVDVARARSRKLGCPAAK